MATGLGALMPLIMHAERPRWWIKDCKAFLQLNHHLRKFCSTDLFFLSWKTCSEDLAGVGESSWTRLGASPLLLPCRGLRSDIFCSLGQEKQALWATSCPPHFLSILREFQTGLNARIVQGKEMSESFGVNTGVEQGCVLD